MPEMWVVKRPDGKIAYGKGIWESPEIAAEAFCSGTFQPWYGFEQRGYSCVPVEVYEINIPNQEEG